MENIESCTIDQVALAHLGGAGIHFMMANSRYRVMFNFLDHPVLLLGLLQKKGPVQDIGFSTRHPEQVKALIDQLIHPIVSA
ncbi:MAG: hypothetical protein JW726_12820 [Anaerolineales bacterium]|nr:hypothetical protein [Anaerolineales bacterium]